MNVIRPMKLETQTLMAVVLPYNPITIQHQHNVELKEPTTSPNPPDLNSLRRAKAGPTTANILEQDITGRAPLIGHVSVSQQIRANSDP